MRITSFAIESKHRAGLDVGAGGISRSEAVRVEFAERRASNSRDDLDLPAAGKYTGSVMCILETGPLGIYIAHCRGHQDDFAMSEPFQMCRV
jgi:hypothetical protein